MSHILAIEPDATRGALLRELVLEHLQTALVLASSTEEAIAAMRGSQPDLILTSMLLAANEEQDLVAHLRATSTLRHIPVLTVPAVSDPSATETRSRGLFSRLRRRRQPAAPMYNFNAVIARIEEALEQSKTSAARSEADARTRAEEEPLVELVVVPAVEPVADSPFESAIMSNGTRKRARRLPMSDMPWLSKVKLSWGQNLRLLNISSTGILFESGVRLSPGSVTKFQLDGPDLTLAVPARVVRCRVSEVDSLGVKYETAAMFDRPVEALVVADDEEQAGAVEQIGALVEAVKVNAACGASQAELRTTFEAGILNLITARDVRLRDVPVVENDGRESIYFTVPTLDGSRAVLQVTFNANDAPGLEDFDVLTAAAQASARILPLTGITQQTTLELQIA